MYNIDNISSIFDNEEDYIEFLLTLKKTNDKEYRKLLAHPKSWIYYCYDNSELHILDIRSSVMK